VKEAPIPSVSLNEQHEAIRDEMQTAIRRVLERQSFILGPEVVELEQEIARLHDCEYAVGCASGSDALLLSLMALGIGPGDAVLIPAFTFFATAGSVARLGARPLFVDIDPQTFNMSPAATEETLDEQTGAAPVKAVIPVHLYGQCADMGRLAAIAAEHRLAVLEDAAQAILARCGGRAAGSFGIAGCFSFYPTKNLAAIGDGGMITTRDAAFAERLRALRNHGSSDKVRFAVVGVNSRLDTLQAAVLLVKLRYLAEWTRQRRQRAAYYRAAIFGAGLANNSEIFPSQAVPIVLPSEAPGMEHVYHQFTVRARRRDELAAHLQAHGIGAAIYYPIALHRQPALSQFLPARDCPEADRAAAEVLSLPLYPELSEAQQDRVVAQIRKFYFP
jgi:dTDP-4-amino-4,6-dideoxygalactose transaminase